MGEVCCAGRHFEAGGDVDHQIDAAPRERQRALVPPEVDAGVDGDLSAVPGQVMHAQPPKLLVGGGALVGDDVDLTDARPTSHHDVAERVVDADTLAGTHRDDHLAVIDERRRRGLRRRFTRRGGLPRRQHDEHAERPPCHDALGGVRLHGPCPTTAGAPRLTASARKSSFRW